MKPQAGILLLLAACAAVAPALGRNVYVSGLTDMTTGTGDFKLIGATPADAVIPLLFAVKQHTSTLTSDLMAVSDPASPQYGQHRSFAEMAAYSNPEGTAAVHRFLQQVELVGVETTPHGEYVKAHLTVAAASKLLSTKFYSFARKDSATNSSIIARCAGYMLPAEVDEHVHTIGYTTSFPLTRVAPSFTAVTLAASGTATPKVIAEYYGIRNRTVTNLRSSNAVFETNGQSFVPSDLAAFDKQYGVPKQAVAKVIGGNSPISCYFNANNCDEAELDVQVLTSVAQGAHTTFWSVPATETFLEFAMAVSKEVNPPLVISVSYTSPESDHSASEVKAFDTEAAKLGLRGVSIFVASGDDGVAGEGARGDASACGFSPVFPSTSPHVTSVGATQGPESGQREVACSSKTGGGITTGGGFSGVYQQPAYQRSVVQAYLQDAPALPPTSQFNTQGRAYPDIAAMGHNYPTFIGGSQYLGSGTSASTPLIAGMVTLINSERMNAGKAPLGFLNPALYSLPASVFHDITSGVNNCAAGNQGQQVCCTYGFTATSGWDPLTGLGSPKYEAFAAALISQ